MVCGSEEKDVRKRFTVFCEYGKVSCDSVTETEDWIICEGTDIKLTMDDEVVGYVKTTRILKTQVISIDENVYDVDKNDK